MTLNGYVPYLADSCFVPREIGGLEEFLSLLDARFQLESRHGKTGRIDCIP